MIYRVPCQPRKSRIRTAWLLSATAVALIAGLSVASPAWAQLGVATVDGGETVFGIVNAWEWNTDGEFEGWGPTDNVANATVAGGAMSGESAGVDPIFNSPAGLNFVTGSGPGEVNRVQFSAQFGAGSPIGRTELFFFPVGVAHGSQIWTSGDFSVITDGDVHTYTLDIDPAFWGLTIGSVRLDPTSDQALPVVETFAYDFFRLGSTVDPVNVAGDVNGDTLVNAADFEIIRSNFFGVNVGRGSGDLNVDGVVDLKDFGQWKDNFGAPAGQFLRQLVGAVPEPGSALLLAIGFTVAGVIRPRRVS